MKKEIIYSYLQNLARNNNREWFNDNKELFIQAQAAFLNIIDKCIDGIAKEVEPLPGVQAKNCIYRIYRDIRFSPDKTPYKKNFSALISPNGKKTEIEGIYIHFQPDGESFIAGGIYSPTGPQVKAIRQELYYNPEKTLEIIDGKKFKKFFGGIQGESLKNVPKEYIDSEDRIAELIKKKQWFLSKQFSDNTLEDEIIQMIITGYSLLKPYTTYMQTVLGG